MKQKPSFHDVEKLSTYLDSQLSKAACARLESRLESEPQLQAILKELKQARSVIKKTPSQHVPRNFYLTPKMVGMRPPLPRSVPVFRFASVTAAVILFFSFAVNFINPIIAAQINNPIAFGVGGGCDSSIPGECGDLAEAPPAETGYGGGPQGTATPEALTAMSVPPLVPGTPTPQPAVESGLRSMEQPTEVASVPQPDVQEVEKTSSMANNNQPVFSDFQIILFALFIVFGAVSVIVRQFQITRWQKRQ